MKSIKFPIFNFFMIRTEHMARYNTTFVRQKGDGPQKKIRFYATYSILLMSQSSKFKPRSTCLATEAERN